MTLIDQINALRQQMRAQRAHSDRLVDAVLNQLAAHAEATRNLEAAFGHLLEQRMRPDERIIAEQVHRFTQQQRQSDQYGPCRGPDYDGGFQ